MQSDTIRICLQITVKFDGKLGAPSVELTTHVYERAGTSTKTHHIPS